jgi:hypothetical protein
MALRKMLTFEQLRDKGWPFSSEHTNRLAAKGVFPHPIKIGGHRKIYWEDEVEAAIEAARVAIEPEAEAAE